MWLGMFWIAEWGTRSCIWVRSSQKKLAKSCKNWSANWFEQQFWNVPKNSCCKISKKKNPWRLLLFRYSVCNLERYWRQTPLQIFCYNFFSNYSQLLSYPWDNCYLAAPRPTLGHYGGGSLTHTMLITAFLREPAKEVGSPSQAERHVDFEPGNFRFWLQHLNPLGHSPQVSKVILH